MLNSLKNTLLLALGALVLNAHSSAQCIQPDNLWLGSFAYNPQCSGAPLSLPAFPGFKQEALELGWQDCQLDSQKDITVKWSTPTNPSSWGACQEMTSQVTLTDNATGLRIARGTMTLTYSRTWSEADWVGGAYKTQQVWRFLVNGDLRYSVGGKGFLRPACATAHKTRVRYSGYVDWALDCNTGWWSNAWMLTHAPDTFEHVKGYPRQGSFHCERSYSFVGPANGFVANPLVPIESGSQGDDYRSVVRYVRRPKSGPLPFPPVPGLAAPSSSFEENVWFSLQPQNQSCPCDASGTGPGQFATASMLILGDYSSTALSSNKLMTSFVSMGIGSWTDPNVYPGAEDVRWTIAEYEYYEPCTNDTRTEIFHGVTTLGGYQAWNVSVNKPNQVGFWTEYLPTVFIDQSNALRRGKLSMNLPFKSDHVLNLNHW